MRRRYGGHESCPTAVDLMTELADTLSTLLHTCSGLAVGGAALVSMAGSTCREYTATNTAF